MFAPVAIAISIVVGLFFAGCSAAPPQPAPSPSPPSGGVRSGPEIGTRSAALGPVRAAVPPTRVLIPTRGIDVAVQPVGVRIDGLMELPADVRVAGWYEYGPDPGSDTGTTVISAHVDSLEYGVGPFSQLKNLAGGELVTVTDADGASHDYAVESVQSIVKAELPLDRVFDRTGPPRLVLITCGGQFDYDALRYSDNVVVVATPLEP